MALFATFVGGNGLDSSGVTGSILIMVVASVEVVLWFALDVVGS